MLTLSLNSNSPPSLIEKKGDEKAINTTGFGLQVNNKKVN
jgi:hypothetical protein